MNRHRLAYLWCEYVALDCFTGILSVFPLQPLASPSAVKLGLASLGSKYRPCHAWLSCRAAERRDDIIACIQQRGYKQLFDMSSSEASQKYLEGTGALVPDRVNGLVYVNLSERADERLAQQWADDLGYKDVITFRFVNQTSAVSSLAAAIVHKYRILRSAQLACKGKAT